eukprot:s345_g29.t1
MKALGHKKAGAAVPVSLLCHEQCDPGFYQAWSVLCTFRRVAHKRPLFLQLWENCMESFDGNTKQVPSPSCLKSVACCIGQLQYPNWQIIMEFGSAGWKSMTILYDGVLEAWSWKVYRKVHQKKDYVGLVGIDHRPQRAYLLSSWAVVNATADRSELVNAMTGHKCELSLQLLNTRWRSRWRRPFGQYTYTAEGLLRLLQDGDDCPAGYCEEDWRELQGLVRQQHAPIHVQHIPGHARWSHTDQDADSWAAKWNDRADREANSMAMKLHGTELLRLQHRLCAHHEQEVRELRELQELHLAVTQFDKPMRHGEAEEVEAEGEENPWN